MMAHHELAPILEKWDVRRASIYMSMWTTPNLLPATFSKPRVDFKSIASYMSRLWTEIGQQRGVVEETWGRMLTEIERIQRKSPQPVTPINVSDRETKEEPE